jgi:predicted CopG family antitoxin
MKTINVQDKNWKDLVMLRLHLKVKTMDDVIEHLIKLKHKEVANDSR